jgi:phosphatidylethanolamine-binding protein (PEBP) family uncharacterized protein
MNLQLTSIAFENGQPIPKRHTGDGEDISPSLAWSDPPKETKTFALICDDPDAPGHILAEAQLMGKYQR